MKNIAQKEQYSERQIRKRDMKLFRSFAAFLLVLCVFIGAIFFWFYGRLHSTIRAESTGYLREIATRVEKNIDRIIHDTYSMLYSTDKMLADRFPATFSDVQEISQHQQQYWKYQRILLIDDSGNAYDVNGKSIFLSGGRFLQDTVLKGVASMSPLQVVDGVEYSIFAVPVENRKIGDIEVSALAVTFDSETFYEVLSMSSFSNQAYSNIVSKDGTVIIGSNSEASADFGYNILSSIESSQSVLPEELSTLRDNMRNGQIGQIEFTYHNRAEYMVHCPINGTDWVLFTFVPVEVVNAKSNILLTTTLLLSGFIVVSFTVLVVILLTSFRSHQRKLEQIAYVDSVTGGNSIERFYELAGTALKFINHPQYALVYTNFGKFKVLNEKFGRPICDEILRNFYWLLSNSLAGYECVGRLSADNFCMLIQCDDVAQITKRIEEWHAIAQQYVMDQKPAWSLPLAEFGIYIIENDTMPFPQMIDRAKLALRETPKMLNAKLRYAVYNDEVRSLLFREKQLEDMMETALASGEFQMYLQPKYSVNGEKIVGAEALSRWLSISEGMIFPNEFIPLFEKNGFIIQLDQWIFEEVCRTLQKWMKEDRTPIKISVNCSRIHLRDSEFLRTYSKIADRYQIPHHLIEIELTESIVLEDAERFKHVVEDIHNAGFGCSMDDFGSGYSSLNMIQDISVDTLKLDKVFFRNATRDPVRTESVISNIIGMAKALSMETVAEGVEHREQVAMLRRVGCDIIQGFVFAKPMPLSDFEDRWAAELKKE